MKFRPKRKKGDRFRRFSDGLPFHVDEVSDDDFDALNQPRFFGPGGPPTPPHYPEDQCRRKLKYTRDVLRLTIHHGDILIQQGPDLQKFYEVRDPQIQADGKHAAVPLGMRIVATARYINTNIHGSNYHAAMEAPASSVPVIVDNQGSLAELPPSTVEIEAEMSDAFLPVALPPHTVPYSAPSQNPSWFFHNPLPVLQGMVPGLYAGNPLKPTIAFHPPLPPARLESESIIGSRVSFSDHFPGLNSKGEDMFPPSLVREERPPVILSSQQAFPQLGWVKPGPEFAGPGV